MLPENPSIYLPYALKVHFAKSLTIRKDHLIRMRAPVLVVSISDLPILIALTNPLHTRLAERAVNYLNSALASLLRPIRMYGGSVLHFDAGSIVAVFPANTTDDENNHALCTAAALAAQKSASQLSPISITGEKFHPRLRIGLAQGTAAVGIVTLADRRVIVSGGTAFENAYAALNRAEPGQIVPHESFAPAVEPVTQQEPPDPRPPAPLSLDEEQEDFFRAFLPPIAKDAGKRRKLTLLTTAFEGIDLSEKGALGALQSYASRVEGVAKQFGGTLYNIQTRSSESHLQIAFGLDDRATNTVEKRASLCALALRDAPFNDEQPFRVGLAAGATFIGDIGGESRRTHALLGRAVLISRQQIDSAKSGQISVNPAVHDAGGPFTYEITAPLAFQDTPIAMHALTGHMANTAGLRRHTMISSRTLIGRESEMNVIKRAIAEANAGERRVLILESESGAGKSRLIEEVVREWLNAGGIGFWGSPSPYGIPLEAWIAVLRDVFGVLPEDDALVRGQKLSKALDRLCPGSPAVNVLFANLLDIELPGVVEALALSPQDARARFFEQMVAIIRALAREQPILLVFENLQWASSTEIALIDYVTAQAESLPVLICIEAETALPMELRQAPYTRILPVGPLPELCEERVSYYLPGEMSAADATKWRAAVDRQQADCKPLFAEAALLAIRELPEPIAGQSSPLDPIPDSVGEILAGTVARLNSDALSLLQIAAAAGMVFESPLLTAISPTLLSQAGLWRMLDAMEEAGIIFNIERQPPFYRRDGFRHAAIREAAYRSMDAEKQRLFHYRIAKETEIITPNAFASRTHHYEAARYDAETAENALLAGIGLHDFAANDEALHYYALAERHLENLPEKQRWPFEIEIGINSTRILLEEGLIEGGQARLDRVIALAEQYDDARGRVHAFILQSRIAFARGDSDTADASILRAAEIAEAHEHHAEMAEALYHLGRIHHADNAPRAIYTLKRAHDLADRAALPNLMVEIDRLLGEVYFEHQRYGEALDFLQEALNLIRPSGHQQNIVDVLLQLGQAQLYIGDVAAALQALDESVSYLREEAGSQRLSEALMAQASAHSFAGRYDKARTILAEVEQLCNDEKLCLARCCLILGRDVACDEGSLQEAEEALTQALAVFKNKALWNEKLNAQLALIDVFIRQDRLDEAEKLLEDARAQIEERVSDWFRPQAETLLGKLRAEQGQLEEAHTCARRALGAVGLRGDLRVLPSIYRLLARTLINQPDQDADALLDTLSRSVAAASEGASKLDLALSLQQSGQYMNDSAQLSSTVKARGSRLLFEAERLFKEMAISPSSEPGIK